MLHLPRLLLRAAARAPQGVLAARAAARLPARHRGFRVAASPRADSRPAAAVEPAEAARAEPAAPSRPPAADALEEQLSARLSAARYDEVIAMVETQLIAAPATLTPAHWNVMLHALEAKGGPPEDVSAALDRMRAAGVPPNEASYAHALRACARGKDAPAALAAGLRLLEQSRGADGLQPGEELLTELLHLHMAAADTDGARALLPKLAAGELSRFRASLVYLRSALAHGATAEYVAHLSEMRAQNRPPRAGHMRTLLKQAVSARAVDATMASMDALLAYGDVFDPMSALLLLANKGAFDARPAEAERLLRQSVPLLRPGGQLSSDRVHVLERLLPLLSTPELKTRVIAVIAASRFASKEVTRAVYEMAASGREQGADAAFGVLEQMHERGELVTTAAVNAVISMCAHIKDLDRAVETFQSLEGTFSLVPDTGSYNALLLAAFKARKPEAIAQVRERMAAAAMPADADTHRILSMVLLSSGQEAQALQELEKAKAANLLGAGTVALFLKHFLSLPAPGEAAVRKTPDFRRAEAFMELVREKGLRLIPRFREQAEKAIRERRVPARPEQQRARRAAPARAARAYQSVESYEEVAEVAEGGGSGAADPPGTQAAPHPLTIS